MSEFQPSILTKPNPDFNQRNLEAILNPLMAKINHLEQELAVQTNKVKELEQQFSLQTQVKTKAPASHLTSRRKLLKRVGYGIAAVAATGAAGLTQGKAQAASGDYMALGQTNNTIDNTTLNSGATIGLSVQATSAPLRLVPASFANAPASGSHLSGELLVDSSGNLFLCKVSGTPGTWVQVNNTVQSGVTTLNTLNGTLNLTGSNGISFSASGSSITAALPAGANGQVLKSNGTAWVAGTDNVGLNSVNSVSNAGANIDLIAGPNIGITPNNTNKTITIGSNPMIYGLNGVSNNYLNVVGSGATAISTAGTTITVSSTDHQWVPLANPYRMWDYPASNSFGANSNGVINVTLKNNNGGFGYTGVPSGAIGVSGTVIIIGPTYSGSFLIWPYTLAQPSAATMNVFQASNFSAGFTSKVVGDGLYFRYSNGAGGTYGLQIDITGYFI